MIKKRIDVSINRGKNIGKVLIITEGKDPEIKLLKKIFNDILDYDIITKANDENFMEFKSKTDNYSRVFVVQCPHSNIISIDQDQDKLEIIYLDLLKKYQSTIDNAATYYIFDRDRESNTYNNTLSQLRKYVNAREGTEFSEAGMLLLSYPSIEAYEAIIDGNKCQYFCDAKEAKKKMKYFDINNISEEDLIQSCKIIVGKVISIIKRNIEDRDYDNLLDINLSVFNYEEDLFINNSCYYSLSLIIFMLLDLNILEISDDII